MSELDASSSCVGPPAEMPADWIVDGGFILLIACVAAMFWGLSFVCEEYSVPAITVFCKRNRISDDIAGAIFIGTGLSLPVLFASFVGLFVSKTSIGVGTVVGGNIFNQLVNIALSVQVSPAKMLKVDAVVLTREMVLYLISCVLVIWAAKGNMHEAFLKSFDHDQWVACLSIPWASALVLVLNYAFYCVFDGYFNDLSNLCSTQYRKYKTGVWDRVLFWYSRAEVGSTGEAPASSNSSDEEDGGGRGEVGSQDGDVQITFDNNIREAAYSRHRSHTADNNNNSSSFVTEVVVDRGGSIHLSDTRHFQLASLESADTIAAPHLAELPMSAILSEDDSPLNDFSMFLRSAFYNSNDFGCIPSSRKWKLRYFTFNNHGLFYKLDYYLPMRGHHVRFIDVFDLEEVNEVDRELMEFNIKLRLKRKSYNFRAPSEGVYYAVLAKLRYFLNDIKKRSEDELRALAIKSMNEIVEGVDELADPDNESVGDTAFVVPVALLYKMWYYFTLPLKTMVYYTTPDVRRAGSEQKALWSILVGFVWVAVMTYLLIDSLSTLAVMLNISGTVMGLTVGAWAASYPALWSSVVVARNGFGDIAVCNALGSNVFSNLIGLGLPWLTYIVVHKGQPYEDLRDEGVVLSMMLLAAVGLATYAMIALANWTLKHWMVNVLGTVYVAFIAYFIYFSVTL